jgi:exosome complex RNA-binding protein Csl4
MESGFVTVRTASVEPRELQNYHGYVVETSQSRVQLFEARSDDFDPGDDFRQTRFLVAIVRALSTATALE